LGQRWRNNIKMDINIFGLKIWIAFIRFRRGMNVGFGE
jgi:hypothetical protein